MLSADMEGVAACHKSSSAWSTLWLDVILLKDHSSLGQGGEVGGLYCGVVPGNIIETKVVSKDEDNMGLLGKLVFSVLVMMTVAALPGPAKR